jgi:hypothetical protein
MTPMRAAAHLMVAIASAFVVAAIVSFVVNYREIDGTTRTLGSFGFGFAMLAMVLTWLSRRGG